ncbi:hypothetical protein DWB85_15590 [Seongchinamella sediminis]|uniref:Uncharacterized protein n=1 Tax=Seongchinamella sediminis TaxID=2283635 RepID=A0A3L7DTD1_9GAMM|nr:hypothetical protein [Seongchinamella sediminis]RLQ20818.1 hypothetical protein DWB85_15590 [Seongchinamella sediminis]
MGIIVTSLAVFAIFVLLVFFLWRGIGSPGTAGGFADKRHKGRRKDLAASTRNRYHAVTVSPMEGGCEAVRNLPNRRYLVDEAPLLPLPNCTRQRCDCKYVHYQDRRDPGSDRRQSPGAAIESYLLRDKGERRNPRGRRREDWAVA